MSENIEKYYIPKHLDAVDRVIIFTPDEFLVILISFGVISIFDLILGMITGVASYFIYKRFKSSIGASSIKAFMYWYLPHQQQKFRYVPCSSKRRWYF